MTDPYGKGNTLNARLVRSEIVSAKEFLSIKEHNPKEIKSSKPVGPTLGKPGFGGIEVTYNTPKYRVA